ncbi:choice-of-anchor J domain-containing protein [Shivajiella indica]|uniref:Choice-of-anchor J domain-containing protein n=1 Tax=Shivajiella indica TaxID=872115 RepID=A0ABW5B925_9BACT
MRDSISKKRISFSLSFFLFLISNFSISQTFFGRDFQHIHDEKCAAVHLEQMQEEELGIYGSKDYFESWIQGKIRESREKPKSYLRTAEEVRLIPVVVHVIHTGTPIGQGPNISKEQIESQIRSLNEDYRRLNPDAAQTPDEFLNVAADARIEFVLAKQDPRGLPTDGINRVLGPKTSYDPNDAGLIGQIALWPPEEYMNIWVVPLVSPLIGYATFPISDLPGLNFPPTARERDGVTVDYRYFGSGGAAVAGSKGRTLTHEVGHFFGLRHIWGDGDCSVDDFVEDTPDQDGPNTICRTAPRVTCNTRDMVENFMDYTTDICMNLFTIGQIERFDAVLANSPRRASLVNGRATLEPVLQPNDLSFDRIINPQDFLCDLNIVPEIIVFNAGVNQITSARVEIRNNNTVLQTLDFALDLATGDLDTLRFNPIVLNAGTNSFQANILLVNNSSDPVQGNNSIASNPLLQPELNLPYALNLSEFGNSWIVDNPDGLLTWERSSISINGQTQEAIRVQNYEYDAAGELDYFISPQINLTEFPNAQLTFKMAHAPYNAQGFGDFLYVAISTDCGNTFEIINAPYNKDRTFLTTSEPTLNEFIPTQEEEFRREIVNLAPFSEFGNVRIAFINRNGYGNNIYIKDVEILTEETYNYSVKLTQLVSPTPISNGLNEQESIEILNTGNLPVSGFIFRRRRGNSPAQSFVARGTALNPGETTLVNLPRSTNTGLNQLTYILDFPNFDQNPKTGNQLTEFVLVNDETIRAPWRQYFENMINIAPWQTINPENNRTAWELLPLQTGSTSSNAIRLAPSSGENSFWLGSPIFDMRVSTQGALFFDRAAGFVSENTIMKVLASADGGVNYQEVFRKSGNELTTVQSEEANPNNPAEFVREYVNLTDFAGEGKSVVRVAIVVEGGSESNSSIYLDNLELFLSANPEPVNPGENNTLIYPNPSRGLFNVAFNLERFETVNIQIISSTGALLHDMDYPNTLNQTYTFSPEVFSKGFFFMKITSQSISQTKKLIIN